MKRVLLLALLVSQAALADQPSRPGQDQPAESALASPASGPATRPAEWGPPQAGLAVSLAADEPVSAGGQFVMRVALRNVAAAAVSLPPRQPTEKAPFAWLFVVQQIGQEKRAWYSRKIPIVADAPNWPQELAGDALVELPAKDVAATGVLAYKSGLKVQEGYPLPDGPEGPAPALSQALAPGPAKVRLMLYLPRQDEPALLLSSNTVELTIAPPDLSALGPQQRKAFVEDLLRRFRASEYAGQQAHRLAVQIGKDVVGDLISAVEDVKAPAFARMWLTTALADIRDQAAAECLIRLLGDKTAGVRFCVAYHGPKQRSDKLDQAIQDAAAKSGEPGFTAYAIVGFAVFRRQVPQPLLKAGLESDDPRVQSAVRNAMKGYASDFNVAQLRAMAKDKDPAVAAAARDILEAMGKPPPTRP